MKRKALVFMLILCIFIGKTSRCCTIFAEDNMKEKQFFQLLVQKAGWQKEAKQGQSDYDIAQNKGIIGNGDRSRKNKLLTRERAALYLCRANKAINGGTYDTDLYRVIVTKGRISDLKDVSVSCQGAVVKMFEAGIMIGDSNGLFSQSRKICPSAYVTTSDGILFLNRLVSQKKRKKISPDGQLIRTSNLPKNAKKYPYILQSFPNSFYQAKFEYQITEYKNKPVNLVDYASPAQIGKMTFTYNGMKMQTVMDQYLSQWCSKVEKNITARFNVNYKTIGTSWIHELRSTYYIFEDDAAANSRQTSDIKDYVKRAKANKVVMKTGRVSVEPSTLYNCGTNYIRVYVKFRVTNCKKIINLNDVIYNDGILIKNVKKGEWKECYFDIGIGSCNGYSLGEDYAVTDNVLVNIK